MKTLKALDQYIIIIIFCILLFSYKLIKFDYEFYFKIQPIIDNSILLMLLIFMLLNSKNWLWISKRILYSILLILFLNTYAQLFGLDLETYFRWYYIPILSLVCTITLLSVAEIGYKLYILCKKWKN